MAEQGKKTSMLVRPGPVLKAFRTERGLTLADVSRHSGLTASTLSKIENGKMELTIDKLVRISLALDVNIADIFGTPTGQYASDENGRRRSITRAGEGKQVSSPSGTFRYQAYDLLNKGLTPVVAEVTARTLEQFGEFHRHDGEEYVHVLEGELALYTDTYTPAYLKKGDSIYFDSKMGHAYVAVGDEPCRILLTFTTSDAVVSLMEGHARPGGVSEKASRRRA